MSLNEPFMYKEQTVARNIEYTGRDHDLLCKERCISNLSRWTVLLQKTRQTVRIL